MTDTVARFYDADSSRNWSQDPEISKLFITHVVNYLNDKLNARGHVFLNEVFDELGMARMEDGQRLGWTEGSTISVGEVEPDDNGVILLEFNVEGDILKKVDWFKIDDQ